MMKRDEVRFDAKVREGRDRVPEDRKMAGRKPRWSLEIDALAPVWLLSRFDAGA